MGKIKKIFRIVGPGVITGAADDDPSGIATYSQAGAQFGYQQLWLAFFTFPCMLIIQQLCGKIGLVTGKGLAQVIRENYGKTILAFMVGLLLLANIINIGADLGAMAASGQLIVHLPFWLLLAVITSIILLLQVFVSYQAYAKILKYLTLSLLAYVISAFLVKQHWQQIAFNSFIPTLTLNRAFFMNIVAILGTTISPYLFFWQAGEEIEEQIAKRKLPAMGVKRYSASENELKKMRLDTLIGMFISNLVMWFIIITSASTLASHGITNVETADQAALALRPLAGDFAFILFTMGIIGTGFLAVPILAGSASYAVAESLGWKEGLYRKLHQAYGFYFVIILVTLLGLAVNFLPIKPFKLLYYTAIFNGLAAPPLLVFILLVTRNKKIMGDKINSSIENIIGWLITVIMILASFALFFFS